MKYISRGLTIAGNVQWKITSDDIEESTLISVAQDNNGDYIAVGQKGERVLALKLDSTGNILWEVNKVSKMAESNSNQKDYFKSVIVNDKGNYAMAGKYNHGSYMTILDKNGDVVCE